LIGFSCIRSSEEVSKNDTGVNVDHIATVRQARLGVEPDPVMAANPCALGGADGK